MQFKVGDQIQVIDDQDILDNFDIAPHFANRTGKVDSLSTNYIGHDNTQAQYIIKVVAKDKTNSVSLWVRDEHIKLIQDSIVDAIYETDEDDCFDEYWD